MLDGSVSSAWPGGCRAAVSLTFDDARTSQVVTLGPLLKRHRVKATFYVTPDRYLDDLDGWRGLLADGHEIGNHTDSHPCSGNYPFAAENPLEHMTVEDMEGELARADERIFNDLGVTPTTFAYPCGDQFVGSGQETNSYVPLISRKYRAGRGYMNGMWNDPVICDLAKLVSVGMDNRSLNEVLGIAAQTLEVGGWLILTGHDVGAPGLSSLCTDDRMLSGFLDDLGSSDSRFWVDTVDTIAQHISASRLV